MPDPFGYLRASGAAAVVSALFVLAMAGARRPAGRTRSSFASALGVGLGLAIGQALLSGFRWPPASALDRLLSIVVPAALAIELAAAYSRVPAWSAWLLRSLLALAIPRILLHGSVYLKEGADSWGPMQAGLILVGCGAALAGTWFALEKLARRTADASVPLALCLSTLCAGLTIMMAGYIKGGAAAFPFVAAIAATSLGGGLIARLSASDAAAHSSAAIGLGVTGLCGLLLIGRFFGRLSTENALVMILSPLLAWAIEASPLRRGRAWLSCVVRIVVVAIPLVVVLIAAKHKFDREMAPLL